MFPKRRASSTQSGFAMAVVIAILAALAVFGASVVVVSTTQQAGTALDLQGARAYHAARGGLEWSVYHVLRSPGVIGCADINGKSVVYGGNLADFRVTLACSSTAHEEASAPVTMYAITATACNDAVCPTVSAPPPIFYVERQLRVTVGSN